MPFSREFTKRLELDPRYKGFISSQFLPRCGTMSLHRNRQWLATLRADYRLGVSSATTSGIQRAGVMTMTLSPLLEVIVDSTIIGIKKPDSGIFRAALSTVRHIGKRGNLCRRHLFGRYGGRKKRGHVDGMAGRRSTQAVFRVFGRGFSTQANSGFGSVFAN